MEFAGSDNPGQGDCTSPLLFPGSPPSWFSVPRDGRRLSLSLGHSPTWGAAGTVGEQVQYIFICLFVCVCVITLVDGYWVLDYPQFIIHKIRKIKVKLETFSYEISPTVC